MEYSKHFVCFLDILGFKNLIANSTSLNEIGEIGHLLGYFKYFHEKFNNADANDILRFTTKEKTTKIELNLKLKTSFFSDSIILSFEVVEFRQDLMQLYYIINQIAELAFEVTLYCGRFMRGGLTYGDLYHENDVCFGPALIEAVQLEKDAVYPRISVAPKVIDYTSGDFPLKHLNIEQDRRMKRTFAYIQREILSTDLTGQIPIHYIDFLWRYLPESEAIANRLKDVILTQLNKDYDDYIMRKYVWFANCYNFLLGSYTQHKIAPIDINSSLLDDYKYQNQGCEEPNYLLPQ